MLLGTRPGFSGRGHYPACTDMTPLHGICCVVQRGDEKATKLICSISRGSMPSFPFGLAELEKQFFVDDVF